MQYSALKQINKSNVANLRQAWFYPTPATTGRFAFTPLVLNGVMYVALKDGSSQSTPPPASASFSSQRKASPPAAASPTGHNKDNSDQRLIFSTNSYMQEINLRTGVTIPSFGNDGRVDLREGPGPGSPKQFGVFRAIHPAAYLKT